MSAVATPSQSVRVWRVVPEPVHPEAAVDVSAIEPTTGLTQRAARELANDRNHACEPSPQIQWEAKPTGQVVDRRTLNGG